MAKRKASHDHHGGAWKVAGIDFFTSMTCLFMVLWILAQNIEVEESIVHYFLDPFSASIQRSPGVVTESSPYAKTTEIDVPKRPAIDVAFLRKLAEEFYKLLNLDVPDQERAIDIDLTTDGLFITLFNRDDQPIFKRGTTEFTEWGEFVMQKMSWLIARHDMFVKVSSHVPGGETYPSFGGAWELTTDMSHAVRKKLDYYANGTIDFDRVSGYGDVHPIENLPPEAQENQRVELDLVLPQSHTGKHAPLEVPDEAINY